MNEYSAFEVLDDLTPSELYRLAQKACDGEYLFLRVRGKRQPPEGQPFWAWRWAWEVVERRPRRGGCFVIRADAHGLEDHLYGMGLGPKADTTKEAPDEP